MNSSDLLRRKITVDKMFADSSPFDDCAEVKEIPRIIYYPIELVEMQDRKSTLEKLRETFSKTKYRNDLMKKSNDFLLERLHQSLFPGDIVKFFKGYPEGAYKVIEQDGNFVILDVPPQRVWVSKSAVVLAYRPASLGIEEMI